MCTFGYVVCMCTFGYVVCMCVVCTFVHSVRQETSPSVSNITPLGQGQTVMGEIDLNMTPEDTRDGPVGQEDGDGPVGQEDGDVPIGQ
jgi:hypothetical protein